ncbi:MAG: FixG Ig-like domain-containing protein, partial [Nanoarchaeota archaeon]
PGNLNVVDIYTTQDVFPGQSTVYPLKITNTDDYAKSYTITITGLEAWGTYYLESGSVVIIQPGQEKVIPIHVYVSPDAAPGERVFTVRITHGQETSETTLIANIKGKEKNNLGTVILVLEILLGILILAALVLGVNYVLKRQQAEPRPTADNLSTYY